MQKLFYVIIFVVLISFFIGAREANSEQYDQNNRKWPTCIGEICFMKKLPDSSFFVKKYGRGECEMDLEETLHCYNDSEAKLFVKIWSDNDSPSSIFGILISNMPNCKKAGKPFKPFEKLKTAEGLVVGDSYKKVIELYGMPLFIKKGTELKDLQAEYLNKLYKKMEFDVALGYGPGGDELLFSWIFIKRGKVKAILVGVFE